MNKNKKIFAIFIAYNAEKSLKKFYKNFPKRLFDKIILVDDASHDNTFPLAKKLGIKAYKNPKNLGYGGNLKRAIAISLKMGADILVDIHPDGEYSSLAIPKALRKILSGYDFVMGNRFYDLSKPLKNGMFPWKFVPIIILNFLTKIALGLKITDFHQGFRVYTRKMLEKVSFEKNSNNFVFSYEIIVQAAFHNLKVGDVPVDVHYSGKKRGATFKSSLRYSLNVFDVTFKYFLAKVGITVDKIFKAPKDPLNKRIKNL